MLPETCVHSGELQVMESIDKAVVLVVVEACGEIMGSSSATLVSKEAPDALLSSLES